MAEEPFAVKLLNPNGRVLEDRALQVSVPMLDGEITVLTKHTRYVGLVGAGILSFHSAESGNDVQVVVTGGFCQFANDMLTILADTTDRASDIAAMDIKAAIAEGDAGLMNANGYDSSWQTLALKAKRLRAIQELAGRH